MSDHLKTVLKLLDASSQTENSYTQMQKTLEHINKSCNYLVGNSSAMLIAERINSQKVDFGIGSKLSSIFDKMNADVKFLGASADTTHVPELMRSYESIYKRPEFSHIEHIMRDIQVSDTLAAAVFTDTSASMALQGVMSAMRNPWINSDHVDRSARAFAEIQAIGRTLNEQPPFGAGLAASLRPSLGDWRDFETIVPAMLMEPTARVSLYTKHGFDSSLTDFLTPAFDEAIEVAGLQEPTYIIINDSENVSQQDNLARAREAFAHIQRFEVAMRNFIEGAMLRLFGNDWTKQRLPANMMDGWLEKKHQATKRGETEQSLIYYADFTDYIKIIDKNDNWRDLFSKIFQRREDVRESLQRLHPVRIATMHSRGLLHDDLLLLLVETKRILKALEGFSD